MRIKSNATIREMKNAVNSFLNLIQYEYCKTEEMQQMYIYMQGLSDAIRIIEQETKTEFISDIKLKNKKES